MEGKVDVAPGCDISMKVQMSFHTGDVETLTVAGR